MKYLVPFISDATKITNSLFPFPEKAESVPVSRSA